MHGVGPESFQDGPGTIGDRTGICLCRYRSDWEKGYLARGWVRVAGTRTDLRFDYIIGLWAEAAWINKRGVAGSVTNQQLWMVEADYTFGLGNGLNVMAEHMLIWNGEKPFDMTERRHMSALSVNYPLGLWNNLSHQEKQ